MRADTAELPFEDAIIQLAGTLGWRRHAERGLSFIQGEDGSTRRAGVPIKGDRGFPDLVLAHPTLGIVIAELKSATGSMGPGQVEWIDAFAGWDMPGSPVLVEVWQPKDWKAIELCLTKGVDAYRFKYRKIGGSTSLEAAARSV